MNEGTNEGRERERKCGQNQRCKKERKKERRDEE